MTATFLGRWVSWVVPAVREPVAMPGSEELRAAQIASLTRHLPIAAAGNVVNALLTVFVFWELASPWLLLAWLLLTLLFALARLRAWRRWGGAQPKQSSLRALREVVVPSVAAGALWGGASFALFPEGDPARQIFLAYIVGGMAGGAIPSLSAAPRACIAYVLAAILPLAFRFAWEAETLQTVMAVMGAFYAFSLIIFARNGYHGFVALVAEKAQNARLAEAAARAAVAEEASRLKSEFLANMSHELRTPLNAIIGFSEMMKCEVVGPLGHANYRGYCNDIHASGLHLLTIINDILDLAKIEAGRMDLRLEDVDLVEFCDTCRRLVLDQAEAAGIALQVLPFGPVVPALRADATKLRQILLNLLSNAIKFTPRGGAVTIAARATAGDDVSIFISDTGIGMSTDDLALALQPFRQVDNSHARRYQGTGLGLPLAQALVKLHGGRLDFESQPNRGTTVAVTLPSGSVGSAPEAARISA